MKIHRLRSLADFEEYCRRNGAQTAHERQVEAQLLTKAGALEIPRCTGRSYQAGQQVEFPLELHGGQPNWREGLTCPITGLNNRLRAALHVFDIEAGPYGDEVVYLSEQKTPCYAYMAQHFPNLIGSEFVTPTTESGAVVDGIRHEDMTNLSFADESIDHVLSFEVLEHIPDYQAAFAEAYRVLRPGGLLVWTVPFLPLQHDTLVRATVAPDGSIIHHEEPEYHGDPMVVDGILCFYHFGWQMFEVARSAGFVDAYACYNWSGHFVYLGGGSTAFIARK